MLFLLITYGWKECEQPQRVREKRRIDTRKVDDFVLWWVTKQEKETKVKWWVKDFLRIGRSHPWPNPWCRDKFPGNQLRTNPSIVRYQFITSGIFQLRNDRTARATLACINNLILLRLLYLSTICDKNVRFGVDKVNYPPIPIFCLQDSIGFEFGDAGVGNGGKNSVCQFPELLGKSRVSSTYSLRKYKDCR